jgi:aminopeptidase N
LSAGSGVDLSNFLTWYNQPGTPKLEAQGEYDAAQTYRLSFKQSLKSTSKISKPQSSANSCGSSII